jgi:hypothetical protein
MQGKVEARCQMGSKREKKAVGADKERDEARKAIESAKSTKT